MARSPRSLAWGALVGFGGTAALIVLFSLLRDVVPIEVPLLVLLLPISLSSGLAGWRIGVGVAVAAGFLYALSFLEPIGGVRIGLTHDVVVLAVFVVVGLAVGLAAGRERHTLTDLDEERALLLRSVSHDLRAPLNTIKLISTDLLERYDGGAGLDEAMLGVVVDETDRLDRIVGNLLSYSRVKAGTFAPDLEPLAVAGVLRRCLARMGRVADDRIDCTAPTGLPDVVADAVQIDQVLTNLVENALRHAPAGTLVVIGAQAQPGGVELYVDDQGPGVPPEVLTGERPLEPRRGSVGLGLTVCRAIVAAHGSRLTSSRPIGGGSRVSFVLPAAVGEPDDAARTRTRAAGVTR